MLRINLSILGFLFTIVQLYCQSFIIDSTKLYVKKPLALEEVNILSSYYQQEGIHSAITGGIGTEKLSDYANVINLKLSKYNNKGKKISFTGELGVDYYTSASSDKIDTKVSSASSSDVRIYPTFTVNVENDKTGNTFGGNVSISKEFDYFSSGLGLSLGKASKNKNREFTVRANAFLDSYTIILPSEFRTSSSGGNFGHGDKGIVGTKPRNSFETSFSLSQIVNRRFQLALTMDLAYQSGFLSTPFHRVYFDDGTELLENLPGARFKVPVSLRANYFVGERLIVRSFYRFFKDDWGMTSHTANVELPVKVTPFFSVTPFYRYYKQTAINYFAPYKENQSGATYYTSDYDLSGFTSQFYGLGLRYTPFTKVANQYAISQLELRAAKYDRSDGLNASIVSLHLQIKKF